MPVRRGPPRRTAPATVLWSDARLVAIDKPPGLSLATPAREPHAAVRRLVEAIPAAERADHGLDPDTLRLVHRLDVGTSGVVLLARDDDAHRAVVTLFAAHAVRKTYLALAWGCPRPREGVFDAPLGPDRSDRRRMIVDPAGRHAVTHYCVLSAPAHASLVELRPETGRTHQIRVHLAHAGHPIVGDDLYGGPRHHGVRDRALAAALDPPHTLLHASRLELPAGEVTGGIIFTAPLPPAFAAALDALGIVR